jgi:hypothetical protein
MISPAQLPLVPSPTGLMIIFYCLTGLEAFRLARVKSLAWSEVLWMRNNMQYGVPVRTVFFLILVCETIDTATTPGLLCQPRVIVKMIVEKQMECRLEVLGENLPQRHFCPSQNPT